MNIREFLYVVTVFQEGSISRAAEKLHVSQSSLSKFLSALEKNQGYLIFDRKTMPLSLTEYGQEYVKTAQNILVSAADLERRIDEKRHLKSSHLRVGMNMTRSFYCLHEFLPLFLKQYPGVTVAVTEGRTLDLTEFLLTGRIDVIIVDGLPQNDRIDFQVLKTEPFYLATQPDFLPTGDFSFEHALAHLPAELQQFILLPSGTIFRSLAEQVFCCYNMTPQVNHTTQTASAAIKLCHHGLGLTFVSSLVKDRFEASVKPDYYLLDHRFSSPVVAACRKDSYIPLAVQPFIEVMKMYLKSS